MHSTEGFRIRDADQDLWLLPGGMCWGFFPFLYGGGSLGGPTLACHPLPSCPRFSQQQSFVQILQEVNDFAGQRELVAENLSVRVCLELAKYSQEMKQERKMVSDFPLPGSSEGRLTVIQVSLTSSVGTALSGRPSGPAAAGKWLQTAGECEFVGVEKGGSGPAGSRGRRLLITELPRLSGLEPLCPVGFSHARCPPFAG